MGNFHNNPLPSNHFRKDWQRRVKTWFNQPGRKARRNRNRVKRAAELGARPIKSLRPVVRCPTVRYNMKVREGHGFSLTELKEAGIHKLEARGLGIKVDKRRRNLSEEGKKANVDRLLAYKSRLLVFSKRPRNAAALKKKLEAQGKMDKDKKPRFATSDVPYGHLKPEQYDRNPVPLPTPQHEPPRAITAEERNFNAYKTLRDAWQWDRDAGKRDAEARKACSLTPFHPLFGANAAEDSKNQ
ncbi:60S ribosomal protein L13 [Tulasnella sp. 403]|nr:60S ribosomal protein L13 [Tulasnella sp. 403]